MDVRAFNRQAWDNAVSQGNPWTVPVSAEQIAAARQGHWEVLLTGTKPVPRGWFPPLDGAEVLCLASGGGLRRFAGAVAGRFHPCALYRRAAVSLRSSA